MTMQVLLATHGALGVADAPNLLLAQLEIGRVSAERTETASARTVRKHLSSGVQRRT